LRCGKFRFDDTGSITVGTVGEIPTGSREDKFKYLDEATDVTGFVLDGHPLAVRLFGLKDDLGFETVEPS
jgi:hypothetical protein